MSRNATDRPPVLLAALVGGALALAAGCGGNTAELERARRAEEEATHRLRECQEELARARQELEAARGGTKGDGAEAWRAARLTAEVFVEAVNSRNAGAADAVGTRAFRAGSGGAAAVGVFGKGRFRGEAGGYTCERLSRLEPVPGQEEFVGGGKLAYRGVLRLDSGYTLRLVREDGQWRVASFTAVEH